MQSGSLRVAILGVAIFGFMFLWSNMQGDLPAPEVTLAAKPRLHPDAARHALFTFWRRTQIRYQPTVERLSLNLNRLNNELVEFGRRIKLRRTARKNHRSVAVTAIRSLQRIDSGRMYLRLVELIGHSERNLQETVLASVRDLIDGTVHRMHSLRIELPRISAGLSDDDRTTK